MIVVCNLLDDDRTREVFISLIFLLFLLDFVSSNNVDELFVSLIALFQFQEFLYPNILFQYLSYNYLILNKLNLARKLSNLVDISVKFFYFK